MTQLKHVLASQKDKKATISSKELSQVICKPELYNSILIYYMLNASGPIIGIVYTKSRNGKTFYAATPFPVGIPMPKVGSPVYLFVQKIETID